MRFCREFAAESRSLCRPLATWSRPSGTNTTTSGRLTRSRRSRRASARLGRGSSPVPEQAAPAEISQSRSALMWLESSARGAQFVDKSLRTSGPSRSPSAGAHACADTADRRVHEGSSAAPVWHARIAATTDRSRSDPRSSALRTTEAESQQGRLLVEILKHFRVLLAQGVGGPGFHQPFEDESGGQQLPKNCLQ